MCLRDASDFLAQLLHACTGLGTGGDDAHAGQPIVDKQLVEGAGDIARIVLAQLVRLVEDSEGDGAVGGVRTDELIVDDAVGVLLGVGNPDEHIHLACQALGNRTVLWLDGIEIR